MKNKISQSKNKKADVPVTILVIGVIAVCALALLSFLSSSFKLEQSFTGVSAMEELNAKINEYHFYKNMGVSEEQINQALNITEGCLEEYRISTSMLPWKKDEFLFSVKYTIP